MPRPERPPENRSMNQANAPAAPVRCVIADDERLMREQFM